MIATVNLRYAGHNGNRDVRIQHYSGGSSRDRFNCACLLYLWNTDVCGDNVSGYTGIEQRFGVYGGSE